MPEAESRPQPAATERLRLAGGLWLHCNGRPYYGEYRRTGRTSELASCAPTHARTACERNGHGRDRECSGHQLESDAARAEPVPRHATLDGRRGKRILPGSSRGVPCRGAPGASGLPCRASPGSCGVMKRTGLPPSLRGSAQAGDVAIHDAVEGFQDRLLAGHPPVRERVPDLGEREEEVEEEGRPRLDCRPLFSSTARTASGEAPRRANRSKTRPSWNSALARSSGIARPEARKRQAGDVRVVDHECRGARSSAPLKSKSRVARSGSHGRPLRGGSGSAVRPRPPAPRAPCAREASLASRNAPITRNLTEYHDREHHDSCEQDERPDRAPRRRSRQPGGQQGAPQTRKGRPRNARNRVSRA